MTQQSSADEPARRSSADRRRDELEALKENERSIRDEIEKELLALGKRVRALHRSARNDGPFGRYKSVMQHLKRLNTLEHAGNANRMRLNRVRDEATRRTR